MIGTSNYRFITEVIAESHDLGRESLPFFIDIRNSLFNADINTNERFRREIFAQINNTYSFIFLKHVVADSPMRNFVKSLNQHVLKYYGEEYGYETMDEFLEDQFLEVPQTFASISKLVGFNITKIGDKSASWEDMNSNWEDIDLNWEYIGWENI